MEPLTLFLGIFFLSLGIILGYFVRQSIAKRNVKTIEARLQKKIERATKEAEKILLEAKEKARSLLSQIEKEEQERKKALFKREEILLKRENLLETKLSEFEKEKKIFAQKVEELREMKKNLEEMKKEVSQKLEKISGLTQKEAKAELFNQLEKEYQKEILERIKKLELDGEKRVEKRAKEILAFAIQKYALPVTQETTTSIVTLPNEEMKSRIIGKEGRNIRTFEKLTGVEVIIDETPETVTLSCFDPIKREIAKLALEKLIQDGRIQPAKIEEKVEEAKKEINSKIKEAGEMAAYELGIVGLDPKLIQLLGRLKYRTSYGQNVLLHSIEVAYLAEALANELGADALLCKKAGLFHDIGKAVDQEIEGSHTDIGIKILEKFGEDERVIKAMKSHHGEYPYESLEAVLVQVADQISAARPGARKETIENYLKRIEALEKIATSFSGVKEAWVFQAGREVRVFVKPEEIDDLGARKMAKEIANRIEEELKYPGEIKVNVIRELRVTEYAK